MKKLFPRILPLLAIILFIGCDKTDDNPTATINIEGTWQFTGFYDYTQEKFNPIDSECNSETTTFNKNGTGTTVFTDCIQGNGSFPFLWEKHDAPNAYNQTIEDIIYRIIVTYKGNNTMYISYAEESAKVYERILEE